MGDNKTRLDWVQTLRGIAALMVVMVHSRFILQGSPAGDVIASVVIYPMAMGVDLFFVISGFLMVLTTQNFDGTKGYAWTFFAKRMARIWPIYAIVSVMALFVDHHGLHALHDQAALKAFGEGLIFMPHDPMAQTLYFNMALNVAWTLCFEFYFYIVFAASMLFGRYRYGFMAMWFLLTLVAIPAYRGSFAMNVIAMRPIASLRYANLAISPIIWDFIFGMLAAWVYRSRLVIRSAGIIYTLMGAVVCAMLIEWSNWGFANFHGPAGWGAPIAVIFLGIVMLSKLGEISVPKWTIWLGGISYSLYLTHLYAFNLVTKAVSHLPMDPGVMTTTLFVMRPVAAIVVAYVVYRSIETPTSALMIKALLKLRRPAKFAPVHLEPGEPEGCEAEPIILPPTPSR